jgi:hypothetical protein
MPRGAAPTPGKNSGAEAGRALFVFTPVEAGKVFEELSRLQRPFAEIIDDPDVAEIFRRRGWEILGPSPF